MKRTLLLMGLLAALHAAADAGVPYLAGRTVLAHQGYAQFAAFTGRLPPKAAMLAALGAGDRDEFEGLVRFHALPVGRQFQPRD